MQINSSALRHGLTVEDIEHAWEMALGTTDLDPSHDPPKRLCIGPDHGGNLLELVYLEATDDESSADITIIHAMRLTARLRRFLRRLQP